LSRHARRHERRIVVGGRSEGHLLEQRDEIAVRVDAIRLAGFGQRVEIAARLCACNGVGEQPSLPTTNGLMAFSCTLFDAC
jgi:hypothetical protein